MAATHIVDQVTDIAVIVEFIELWLREEEYDKKYNVDYCPGINAQLLTFLSIFSFILYRVVSAISIYQLSNNKTRFFLQLLDLELFRALRVNYLNGNTEPCYPQRQIRFFESMLESTPQVLIQLFFAIKSNQGSTIVYISIISSFLMIASKVIAEDKYAMHEIYQKASLDKTNIKNILMYVWIKRGYLFRSFYRLVDIVYRLSVALLMWLFIGGTTLFVAVAVECVIVFIVCRNTEELSVTIFICAFVSVTFITKHRWS